jgi:hypothetical protein
MRTAIAAGSEACPLPLRLINALDVVLPYAENDSQALYECWKSYGEADIKAESDACDKPIDEAHAALAQAKADRLSSRFAITRDLAQSPDRVYVMIDGIFDVHVIRTDEGVVVDIYPKDGMEPIASTYAFDSELWGGTV